MSERARRYLEFSIRWTSLNGIAWSIGLGLVDILIGNPGGLWGWGSALLSGLVIGAIQGLGIHRRNWTSWLIVSTLSWSLSLRIAQTVSYSLFLHLINVSIVGNSVRVLALYIVLGVLGGASSVSLQYFLCWQHVSQSKTWLPVLGISAIIAGLASGLAICGIEALVSLFALYSLWDIWHLLGTGLGGTLFGAISGLPLGRFHSLLETTSSQAFQQQVDTSQLP
jgi:hypothetical protein